MLDINDFVAERGGDPEKVRESQRRRHAPVEAVDEVLALWKDWMATAYEGGTTLGGKINAIKKEIGQKKKAKENADELLQQKAELETRKEIVEKDAHEKRRALDRKVKSIGNYVDGSVPVSDNEDNNALIRDWKPDNVEVQKKDCLSHHEVLTRLGGYDSVRGVKIVGHRGYCLTGYGVFLNLALIQYGLEFLHSNGYSPNQPPFFMNKDSMAKTAQLEQFDEELYHVSTGNPDEDKYLIATSEQPLSCLHEGEWLQSNELPINTCFRKEAGSHGKDAWGIFRVHQFEKIEQFVICKPEESWNEFENMIDLSEKFYQSLNLPYRVVAIVSGALNNAASKKYDLEAWFPFQGEYKELVSCSNCTDYQTRELEIRFGSKTQLDKDARKKTYVHALNATLCATERALCCVLENYQREDGIEVPSVLRKYIPGQPEFLPYIRELPKDTTSSKTKGQAAIKEPAAKASQALSGQSVADKATSTIKAAADAVVEGVKKIDL